MLTEAPVSPGAPPNTRGWRVFAGIDDGKAPYYRIGNKYEFDPSAPFERDLMLRIAWK
jgi:hypothetical protein